MRFTRPAFSIALFLVPVAFGLVAVFADQASQIQPSLPAGSSTSSQSDARVLITISGKNRATSYVPAKSDIAVLDNHRPVEIKELRPLKDEPLIFSLLVDASASMRSKSASQIAGAIKLFSALSKSNYHGYLILFRDGVVTSDDFVDPAIAELILRRDDARAQSTGLYDAVEHAVKKQLTLPQNLSALRRAIFVFTDGGDNASHVSLDYTLKLLQTEGIAVFCTEVPTETKQGETGREHRILRTLSRETGGDAVPLDDSGAFVSKLLESVDSQYLLSFSALPEKRHEQHSLEVKSVSKDIKIAAPSHFLAP